MNSNNDINHDDDLLYIRPEVVVDGKRVDVKQEIEGKTLEVYEYLAKHPGSHGVRELQKILHYGSPSTVYYHLNKLLEIEYIEKTEDGRYFVDMEIIDLKEVGSHLKFMNYWVPRSLAYAIPLIFLGLVSVFYYIIDVYDPGIWMFTVAPILFIIGGLLLRDSITYSRKFIHKS